MTIFPAGAITSAPAPPPVVRAEHSLVPSCRSRRPAPGTAIDATGLVQGRADDQGINIAVDPGVHDTFSDVPIFITGIKIYLYFIILLQSGDSLTMNHDSTTTSADGRRIFEKAIRGFPSRPHLPAASLRGAGIGANTVVLPESSIYCDGVPGDEWSAGHDPPIRDTITAGDGMFREASTITGRNTGVGDHGSIEPHDGGASAGVRARNRETTSARRGARV